jgi:2-keto-4-pentenoate hydratase
MTDAAEQETVRITRAFGAARLEGRALSAFPGILPANLAQAYRTQEAAISAWPDPVAGWKVARIGPAWQQAFPEERMIGPAFSPNIRVVVNGQLPECPVFAGGFAAVEAEIVVVIGKDAPAAKVDWTVEEAAALIGSVHIGIEVASSPLITLNDLGPGAIISDFGNNWGIVLGSAIDAWRDLEEIAVETFIDDSSVGTGTVDMVKGPLGAVAFTLRNVARRGRPLRAGDVITTGMITGVHDIRIGQHSRHVFQGCGEVGCQIVRAKAYVSGAASS